MCNMSVAQSALSHGPEIPPRGSARRSPSRDSSGSRHQGQVCASLALALPCRPALRGFTHFGWGSMNRPTFVHFILGLALLICIAPHQRSRALSYTAVRVSQSPQQRRHTVQSPSPASALMLTPFRVPHTDVPCCQSSASTGLNVCRGAVQPGR